MLKNSNENRERWKKIKQLPHDSQVDDHDPKVDLQINGFMIKQIVVNF